MILQQAAMWSGTCSKPCSCASSRELRGLPDVQAVRGSRGDDLIAAMQAAVDTLSSLHIVVEPGTVAFGTVQPSDRAIDVLPLSREVVLLRLDHVAREAVEAFRRFARHVTIDFADGRRRSSG